MRSPMFLLRGFRSAREYANTGLGPLERRVLEHVWKTGETNVAGVRDQFGATVAYTTLMTTLDRLFKKGFLTRRKVGRAFFYSAAATPEECDRRFATEVVEGILAHHRATPIPLLSNLVDAVGDADRSLLDELDRLVQEKRERLKDDGA